MKRVGLVLLALGLIFSSRVLAGERHDSAIFLIDVSGTIGDEGEVSTEKKITKSMNERFPDDVMSAGVMIFGNNNPPQMEWVAPVADYNRAGIDSALSGLKAGGGPTPMGAAITAVDEGLDKAKGKKALIIVSDGRNTGITDPVARMEGLKKKHGSNLCVFTIQVSGSSKGGELLEKLAKKGECGKAVKDSDLEKDSDIQGLVDIIFGGGFREVVKVVKTETDEDGDGVPDTRDKCPGTPAGADVNKRGCWIIKDLNFPSGSAEITPESEKGLNKVVRVLKSNPDLKVTVGGHTDSIGDEQMNLNLSQKRAESVRSYFISAGVEASRITAEGYGESKPVSSNDTPEGRAENRRVEISPSSK